MARTVWRNVLLASLALVGCGGSGQSDAGEARNDASTSDASFDGSPSEDACTSDASSPTQSGTLAAWPDFDAAEGPDLTSSAQVTTTAVGGPPAGIAVSPDGNWVFASVGGGSGDAGSATGLVALRRQGASLTVDHAYAPPSGESAFGLAQSHDGTKLVVGAESEVVLYDLAKVEADAPGAMIAAVADQSLTSSTLDVAFSIDDAWVFAALEYDDAVAVINVPNQSFVGKIPIAGQAVTSVAVSPDGKTLFVVCEVANGGAQGSGTDQNIGSVTVVDAVAAQTNPAEAVLGSVFVGRAPVRALVSPDGQVLWVTARGSYDVVALDAPNLLTECDPLLSTTAVGPAPVGMTLLAGGSGVAVANSNRWLEPDADQTVMILDANRAVAGGASAIEAQISVGAFPRELAGDATSLFVTNYDSDSISGIDLSGLPAP